MEATAELELVEGLKAREEVAVEAFLARYRSLFYHCIGHFETDAAAREDLYQDLVVFVLERLDRSTYDANKGSLGTWLYRVAWCRCVDLKRKEGARRRPRLNTVGGDMPDRADERPGPEEVAGTLELGSAVREALCQLEPQERALLDLRFVQGETLGDIAGTLHISLEQTKYRLRRATVNLRRELLSHYAKEEVGL